MIDGWRRKDSGEPDRGMNKKGAEERGINGRIHERMHVGRQARGSDT